MTRPRIALLQRVAQDLADAARRRRHPREPLRHDVRTDEEFARRLDATRERLRREIPPRSD